MLVVPIDEAEPGMKLVMSVVHPEHPDQELLRPGYMLDRAVLSKLRALEVPVLYVDYPDLAELDRLLDAHLSPARQVIYSQIKQTIHAVQHQSRPTVTFADYYSATRELILTLMRQGDHPIYLDILSGSLGMNAVAHATAVAQLSLTLGIRLEQYLVQQRSRLPSKHAREVINLGVGAMLHDLGKAKLPAQLQQYTGDSEPEEEEARKTWQAHPEIGAEIVRQGVEASATAAIRQHHQYYDGSGFPASSRDGAAPAPQAGDRIHVFARIILAADLYDGLTIGPDKRRRWPIEILHLMRTRFAARIDPHILAFMPEVIPPLPPGTRVTLSDGTTAIVTVLDKDEPYFPTVKRIVDGKMKLAEEPTKLDPSTGPHVVRLGSLNVEPMIAAAERQGAGQLDAALAPVGG